MIKKKGEITTTQIVTWIVLIVSFIVILFFVTQLNLGKTTSDEVCHNSVLTRSTGVFGKETIPLQCKTNYVCISQDGTCEGMTSPEIKKVKTVEEIYEILAGEMYNCWWMFGEGKLNYVGNTAFSEPICSICDQVGFDNSMNEIFPTGEIDKNEFYSYLSNTNISGKDITYLDYLIGLKSSQSIKDALAGATSLNDVFYVQKQFGLTDIYFRYHSEYWSWTFLNPGESLNSIAENGWSTVPSEGVSKRTNLITELNGKNLDEGEIILTDNGATKMENIISNYNTDFGKISLDKKYFIVMAIFSEVDKWHWAIAGAAGALGGAALAVVTGGASIPLTIALVVGVTGGGTGYLVGTAIQGASGQRYLSPTIVEANSEDFNKLKCSSIKTLA
jgi:hypothetical protein